MRFHNKGNLEKQHGIFLGVSYRLKNFLEDLSLATRNGHEA